MIDTETIANSTLSVPHLHSVAGRLFRDGLFGSLVTVDIHGGRAAGMAFCDALILDGNSHRLV